MNNSFWQGGGLPRGQIMFGRLGEENPRQPGTFSFTSSTGLSVKDAHILTPDADLAGNGQASKPAAGSLCVAVMDSDGAGCFVIGFQTPIKFDEDKDDPPTVGVPEDNGTSGDKVFRTSGGATMILKRGGSVIIEGGGGTGAILNPVNNTLTLRSQNYTNIADGCRETRGRTEIGKTKPSTTHRSEYLHQVGPKFDRVRVSYGDLDDAARVQLEIADVTVAASNELAILKTRETYKNDGAWIGEGPKYQWGGAGADEPNVLGNQLVEVLNTLFDIIKDLKVNTAWGPSTPPLPDTLAKIEQLRGELTGKILSTFLFSSKRPATLL